MIPASGRRAEIIILAALLVGGAGAILALKPALYTDARALGMHTVALLVPYVSAVACAAALVRLGRFGLARAPLVLGLFALLALLFADLLASPIVHLEADDSYRYSTYARHILNGRTLWGSDGLLHDARHYVDQPGYRYYLAGAIGLLGGEHRGLPIVNLGILLVATLAVLVPAVRRAGPRGAGVLALFLLASAPYAAKNVLYRYSEWLAVALFCAFAASALNGRDVAALILLGLVPFVRQNLLPISLLLAAWTILRTRRWGLTAPYLLVLGLPLYHNLYYAGEWRFFVENTGALVRPTGRLLADLLAALRTAVSHLPNYLGYAPDQKWTTLAIAIAFAPLGSVLVLRAIGAAEGRRRALLALVAAAAIAPTLLFGSGSFPRFEYVNLSVTLLAFAVIAARGGGAAPGRAPAPRPFDRLLASVYAWGAGVAFVASLGYLLYFYEVRLSEPAGPEGPLATWAALIVNAVLYAAFAAHHSVMARLSAKRWVSRIVTPTLERATYVWVASLLFFAVCFLWRDLPGGLYRVQGLAARPFRLIQLAGIALALASARTINIFALSGIRQVSHPSEPDHAAAHEMGLLETGGPYRLVRHPIYLGTLALLAGTPDMTADRLYFTVLSLAYLVIGVWFEERSLREEFGGAYEDYQKAVRWRLVPGIY